MGNARTLKRTLTRKRQKQRARGEDVPINPGAPSEQERAEAALDARLGIGQRPHGRKYFGGNCLECDQPQWNTSDRPRVPLCSRCALRRKERGKR